MPFTLFWDQPWGGSLSDVDLYVYAEDGVRLLERLAGSDQFTGNPEIATAFLVAAGLDQVQLVLTHAGVRRPRL